MDLTQVITTFGTQGIFACLFIYLLLDIQKTTKEREKRLIDTIDSFTESMDELKEVIECNVKGR